MITRGRRNTNRLIPPSNQTSRSSSQKTKPNSAPNSINSPIRPARSPSPARAVRMQEKDELQNLNSRFANFISHTRKLEEENAHLSTIISTKLNDSYSDLDKVKSLYETELADVRKLLDVTANEKADLQIKLGKLSAEAEESQQKIDDLEIALNDIKEANSVTFAELSKKTVKCDTLKVSLGQSSGALKKSLSDISSLERQLTIARKQLENETLARVEAENALQSLRETNNFNLSLNRELNTNPNISHNGLSTPSYNIQDIYDNIRDQLNDEITEAMRVMESTHKVKVDNLTCQLRTKDEQLKELNDRLDVLDGRIINSNLEINKYVEEISVLNKELRKRQNDLDEANATYRRELRRKIDYINEIRTTLDSTLAEHEDLFDAKLRLDTEIAAYRNLMEIEENRLNLSPQVPVKRRRPDHSASFRSMSYSTGKVQISDADELGSHVTITNTDDKDVDITGWSLRQTVGSDVVLYVFQEEYVLGAHKCCKVWSAGRTHDGEEGTMVLDGDKSWIYGDHAVVRLFDKDGIEVSKREINKVPYLRSVADESNGRCSVM